MSKDKTKRKGKSISKERRKRKTSKEIIPKPSNLRISEDGKYALIEYNDIDSINPKLTGEYRKSFNAITKEDELREYGASYDYLNGEIKNVDLSRGKRSEETDDNRASVVIRVDKWDEAILHNHPREGRESFQSGNRPSGHDIHHLLYLNEINWNVKTGFILSPTGHYVKYEIADKRKANKMVKTANKRFSGKQRDNIDKFLEERYQFINAEVRQERTRKMKRNPVYDRAVSKAINEQNAIGERYAKKLRNVEKKRGIDDARKSKLATELRREEIDKLNEVAENLEAMPDYIPNKKYRSFESNAKKREYIDRLANRRWGKELEKEYGIRITWHKKSYTQDIEL